MPWSAHISSDDVVAIHAALVPTDNGDGQIVLFGGDDHYHGKAPHINTNFDHTRTFNCRTPTDPLIYVRSLPWDVFCCGHALMGNGSLLIAGGTDAFPPESAGIHHDHHFGGHRHCAVYDPFHSTLIPVADMGPEPGAGGTGGGRWYPTLCTLSTGEVLAFEGHPRDDDRRHGNNTPERYQPSDGKWIMLPEVGDLAVEPVLYPRLHLLNDGKVFVSSSIPNFTKNIKVDPTTGAVDLVGGLPDPAYHGFDYPSVLLPLVPSDGYTPRILLCGQTPSEIFDFSDPAPVWKAISRAADMEDVDRFHSCATILPTGEVLLTGGADKATDQNPTGNKPELYHTPLNASTKSYTSGGLGKWETVPEPATLLRNYHSTALLMPDGRVWTAGGNAIGQPYDNEADPAIQKQIEIYQPLYPAGPRPVITACPSFVAYGQHFTVAVLPNADSMENVVLMRCGSSTHAFNPDQRSVWLDFSRTVDTLDAVAPPNGNVAPPGYYMVFVLDAAGRPCEYAKFVRLGAV